MKNLSIPPTAEKAQARKAAEALFGDLLTEVKLGKTRNAKSVKDKLWGSTHTPTRGLIPSKAFTPTLRLFTVTRQLCLTCGSLHEYAGTASVRFEAKNRKDNLALELPYALPEVDVMALPHKVRLQDESTTVCATCIKVSALIDNFLFTQPRSTQMELFV